MAAHNPNSPIERAARALCEARGLDPNERVSRGLGFQRAVTDVRPAVPSWPRWESVVEEVLAVVAALREPSPDMLTAAPGGDGFPVYPEDIWRALIDKLLDDGRE